MEKIQKLKLDKLCKVELEKVELSKLTGGYVSAACCSGDCGCGCLYQGQPGGASPMTNLNANYDIRISTAC